jgi:hypothetical protein
MDDNQLRLEAEMKVIREKTDIQLARTETNHEKMMAKMDVHHENMMPCLRKTEVTALKENQEEMHSGAEQREVSKEHAAVKPIGGLRKRHRGWNLAAEKGPEKIVDHGRN